MADLLKSVFGGAKPQQPAAPKADSGFADFAGAPEPVPESVPSPVSDAAAPGPATTGVPWTKWYNVHERHSLSEFKAEGVILAVSVLIFLFHMLGARANRAKARAWIRANAPVFQAEFALVGFGGVPTMDAAPAGDDDGRAASLLKEKSLFEFATYATGRQNVAFVDAKLTLVKRFNPIMSAVETIASFFSDMFAAPVDAVDVSLYPFDGKESLTVPSAPGAAEMRAKDGKSTYEGFIWAIVHKDRMQKLRDERYDVSLTVTKDHAKLPDYLSIMSENAEVTEALLTTELVAAVSAAGDLFEHLIVSDQPTDKPKTLDEATPRKRLFLRYRLPSDNSYGSLLPLMSYFLRLPDALVHSAQFRPEVTKKLRATREAAVAQIRKAAEEERSEERAAEKEKARKAKRDADLKGLDAKAQKKYLEKEKEKEHRRGQKKMTTRA